MKQLGNRSQQRRELGVSSKLVKVGLQASDNAEVTVRVLKTAQVELQTPFDGLADAVLRDQLGVVLPRLALLI